MQIILEKKPVLYEKAIQKMEKMVNSIISQNQQNTVWLLEHFPVYTAGYTTYSEWVNKYGKTIECNQRSIPLIESERGGKITFHGPGQRVCYLMLNLKNLYGEINLTKFLDDVHSIILQTLQVFGIEGHKDEKYPGVWIDNQKIAAIGIKIRRGISYHGFALNVNTNLDYFNVIEPCGIQNRGVTSISQLLNVKINLKSVDEILIHTIKNFQKNIWNF